ncbi:hypothetical protein SCUCBS95973_009734 [Sporothrix curviconia]|uniref:AMP-dependent synthetase/ligase domain-containing protein n=1 Tax=Sporothrix curviconia TaxID=1260050 RepID=A0ABP0CZW8_9PEZI
MEPLWKPRDVAATNPARFMAHINKTYGLNLQTYHDLHSWSVAPATLPVFWREAYLWLQLAPAGQPAPGPMMADVANGSKETKMFPPPIFFPDDKFNLAEFLLRDGPDDQVAVHFAREGRAGIERVTWRQLRERVRRARGAMAASGVVPGDVVAGVVSNSVDAMVLALAVLALGALWSSSSPDLGAAAIVDRYGQVAPKLVFADDGYTYANKKINLATRLADWSTKLGAAGPGLQNVVVINYSGLRPDIGRIYRGCTFDDFLQRDTGAPLSFDLLPFSHPGFILFSSGTTGKPKCIVHSTGGAALKVKADMILQHDIRKDDVVFQYTTTSWIMWVLNFINISSGKSMLLYDGSPYHPKPTTLLEVAEEVGVSVFGTSPRYIADLRSKGIFPRNYNIPFRTVTSTGFVLSSELYEWFYREGFPPDAQLISMSGGTDLCGSFVCGTPLLPVYSGEIQCKGLGMAVDIMDSSRDEPVSVEASGDAGELVCTQPFPSEPVAFHGKDGAQRYYASYFERFGPSIWCHGDYIQRLPHTNGLAILGRSDGVLNPSGIRFGSAEIYAVTETFLEIADTLCIGQKRATDLDERVLLFVKMQPGRGPLTPALVDKLRAAIRSKYSSRHVPRNIFEVADIPYTVNGKKCEINVKHIVSGRKAAVSGTVANPEVLKLYEQFKELPGDAPSPARAAKL